MTWEGNPRTTTPAHRRWRKAILERDPICRCPGCKLHNGPCIQPATQADHIQAGGPLTMDNGQGLCRPCHAQKSSAEGNSARWGRRNRSTEQHPGLKGGG